jgi:hypothetical protein
VSRNEPATTHPASMLAGAYEQLRRDAIDRSAYGGSLQGLAILMRQGMAAWMRACATVAPSAGVSPSPVNLTVAVFPTMRREVVDVLAAMALMTAPEVRT